MRVVSFFAAILFSLPVNAGDVPLRIISVGGALTEMIYALGEGDRLIGADTTSSYPDAANTLPKVGYQRNLSAEGILSLKPDLLIVSEDAGPMAVLAQVENAGLSVLKMVSAKSVVQTKENLLSLGDVLRQPAKAAVLIQKMDKILSLVKASVKNQKKSPIVLFLMNHGGATPMVAGRHTAAHTLIEMAGGQNSASQFDGYKPLTPEAAVDYAPDIILITTRSLDLIGGIDPLLAFPGVALTPAGKTRNIIDMDGLLLLGFGPRTGEAALILHKKMKAGT